MRDGGPAFPAQNYIVPHDLEARHVHALGKTHGMSMRVYFAAHAPTEIADWFTHVEPPKNFPPMPDYKQLDEAHQKLALDWQHDPIFDLPEELEWYGEKVKAHRDGRWHWERSNERAMYVQWRFAYADAMIEELEARGA